MKFNTYYIASAARPSLVSPGRTFLICPDFELINDLSIYLDWEIKCVGILPDVSLKVEKITYGTGKKVTDFSNKFELPAVIDIPVKSSEVKKGNAKVQTRCELKITNSELPFGQFRVVIKMYVNNGEHLIYQNFKLKKKK